MRIPKLAFQDGHPHVGTARRSGFYTDPDGNLIELYVDATEQIWRDGPSVVANSDPLAL